MYSIDEETRALCRAAAKAYAERECKQLPPPEPIDPLAGLPERVRAFWLGDMSEPRLKSAVQVIQEQMGGWPGC